MAHTFFDLLEIDEDDIRDIIAYDDDQDSEKLLKSFIFYRKRIEFIEKCLEDRFGCFIDIVEVESVNDTEASIED